MGNEDNYFLGFMAGRLSTNRVTNKGKTGTLYLTMVPRLGVTQPMQMK